MKSYKRSQRVADQIRRDVSEVISEINRDSSQVMITVSGVEVSDDLRLARVFYTILEDAEDKIKNAEVFFDSHAKEISKELAHRIRIRRMPELSFHFDKSLVEGMRLTALIDEVMTEENEQ